MIGNESPTDLLEQIRLMNRVHAALSSSLKREEVHTLILATLTAPTGLNFQRAFLFLYDRTGEVLRGHMAMGPDSFDAARSIREEIDAEARALEQIAATMREMPDSSGSGAESYNEAMKGLQHSAYWIAMLQQYHPNNPLTEKLRKVEQSRQPAPSARPEDEEKPRFYDFVRADAPALMRKDDMRLSETMRELLADSFIILPLFTSQGPVGLAVLDNRYGEQEELTEADIEHLGWFSAQTSLALENAELYTDLARTYEALREVDKLKSNFISTISHELRTPLTAINGFIHLLVKGKVGQLTEGQSDLLRRVQNHGQHLTNIVNDLIEVAEVQSGGLEDVDIEVVDPLNCLMNTMPKLEPRRRTKHLVVEPHIEGNVPYIKSNARVLERIFYHLLDNAIKFTEDQGRVDVQFREDRGTLFIDIVDTGIGIAPEKLRSIFESFYQIDNKLTRDYSGLGIGLSVTKLLLESVQGSIHVESAVGKGSTFTIGFPIANVDIDGLPRQL